MPRNRALIDMPFLHNKFVNQPEYPSRREYKSLSKSYKKARRLVLQAMEDEIDFCVRNRLTANDSVNLETNTNVFLDMLNDVIKLDLSKEVFDKAYQNTKDKK